MVLSDLLYKPPYSKLVLIEDTIEVRSTQLLNSIINDRMKKFKEVHYFVFEGRLSKKQRSDVKTHDFCTDTKGWLKEEARVRLDEIVASLSQAAVVVIDSLVHVINEYGLQQTYKWLNGLIQNKSVDIQIITVVHRDLLERDHHLKYLEHLSTFVVSLEPKFNSDNFRVVYTLKKASGKVTRSTEEFWFEGDAFRSKPVERIDVKRLLETAADDGSIPDHLTTFKIGLEEDERRAKEKLVLPFHPSYVPRAEEGGQFYYEFDENDDWDHEDPDDDLDI